MSEYILDVLNQTSKLDWVFPFQRTGAFPLDRSSLFSSLSDAEAYALGIPEGGVAGDERKLAGTSYVGQTVSVYDETANSVSLYIINNDRTLKPVGSAPLSDNASIEIVDGRIQIKDFGLGYYAYIPAEKNEETGEIITPSKYEYTEGFKSGLELRVVALEDGEFSIAWYEPGNETIEDIAANIEDVSKTVDNLSDVINAEGGLVDQVDELKEEIGHAASETGDAATGLYKEIEDLKTGKANANDVYTKEETDKAIGDAVAAVDHLKRIKVNSTDEIDLNAKDAHQYIYMVPTGLQEDDDKYDEFMVFEGALEKVGSWEVNLTNYATKTYVDNQVATKVDSQDGARLMLETEGQKLEGIEAGAQKNYISDVDVDFSVTTGGKLSLNQIAQAKVIGLVSALEEITSSIDTLDTNVNNKVDAVEGSRLISTEEVNKLNAIKDLIQSVDTNKFTIDENGKLLLNSVEIEEIEGLVAALSNKVDKVAGSRLLTSDEAKKLEKLSIDEDGSVGISGTISAKNVQELYDTIVNIVTGTGTGVYDDVNRELLGIQAGAEKNYIASVNESQFTVEDRKLNVKAIDASLISGLDDLLNNKADKSAITTLETLIETKASKDSVTNLETLLNAKVADHEARIAELEGRLVWKTLN